MEKIEVGPDYVIPTRDQFKAEFFKVERQGCCFAPIKNLDITGIESPDVDIVPGSFWSRKNPDGSVNCGCSIVYK